jgi:aryl-alcohol dehydrogenase-like predicted oxidoreductase
VGATFLSRAATANAAWLSADPLPVKFKASDEIVLGHTGIRTSRLAMGTGSIGWHGASNQTRMGMDAFVKLALNGYHENGIRFFDSADGYGSHPYIAQTLKQLPREKVTILTKTDNRTAAGARADVERFRKELGVDMIDIILVHVVTEADWNTRYRGVMDVLSEAKEKGIIRAHGVSCHSIQALRAAAAEPWVEVDLARLNPIGRYMDADPPTVISVLKQMKDQGKGVIGMKIMGQGDLRDKPGEAVRFAMGSGVLDAITVGAETVEEQNSLAMHIAAA